MTQSGAGGQELACPHCGTAIVVGQQAYACPFCQTAHHAECWHAHGGCTTPGCQGGPRLQAAPAKAGRGWFGGKKTDKPSFGPVWAPNPEVPIPARILSYTFGGLMVLTILVALFAFRPLSSPSEPSAWLEFESASGGYKTAYPEGWTAISRERILARSRETQEGRRQPEDVPDIFMLSPSDPLVVMEVLTARVHGTLSEEQYARLDERMAQVMKGEIPGEGFSRAGDDKVGGELGSVRLFTYTATDQHLDNHWRSRHVPSKGGWVYRVADGRVMILIAMAPTESWPTVEAILLEMAERVEFR